MAHLDLQKIKHASKKHKEDAKDKKLDKKLNLTEEKEEKIKKKVKKGGGLKELLMNKMQTS